MSRLSRRIARCRDVDHRFDDGPLQVGGFGDAMGVVLAFTDCLPPCAVAVRLDDDGYLVDALRTDGDPLDIDSVADLALAQVGLDAPVVGGVFFVSVGAPTGVIELNEDLVGVWQRLRAMFTDSGIELLDWFVSGDEHVRSMALCTGIGGHW